MQLLYTGQHQPDTENELQTYFRNSSKYIYILALLDIFW